MQCVWGGGWAWICIYVFKISVRYLGLYPTDSSVGKESACNSGDSVLVTGLGKSPGEGKGYPLQYSGLKNSMNCIVHGVAESDTTERLSLSKAVRRPLNG